MRSSTVATAASLSVFGLPAERREPALSRLARESVITTVTTDVPPYGRRESNTVSSAIALRAVLPEATVLTERERGLLAEWLDRIATAD
jgi:hypothetical protein